MRMTLDPGVGRMSSRKRVIRWIRGAGVTGCCTEGTLSVCGGTGAIASVCCSIEARSPVGSGSFSVSMVTSWPHCKGDRKGRPKGINKTTKYVLILSQELLLLYQ